MINIVTMSSFFTLPASERKRKRQDQQGKGATKRMRYATTNGTAKETLKKLRKDESISGSDSEEDENHAAFESSEDDYNHEEETGPERRLRLAENYLKSIKSEVEVGFDATDVDRDLIAERLQEDVAESKGHLYRQIASDYDFTLATSTQFRTQNECITSIATCPPFVYTVTKEIVLTKWELPVPNNISTRSSKPSKKSTRLPAPVRRRPRKLLSTRGTRHEAGSAKYEHHTASILCVAVSPDGRFVATGGADNRLIIWDAIKLTALRVFTQHRDSVTSLAFRRGTNQLYSSSADRTIKIWSLNELAYVETLFGHQDQVVDIAALAQERCLSAGARDRTVRLWKVIEETQLIFRGGGVPGEKRSQKAKDLSVFAEGSIDRVAMIDDDTFVTGSDNGSLSLWSVHKKKPTFTITNAHGRDPPLKLEEAFAEKELEGRVVSSPAEPRWITALKVLPYSDLVVSGSWDGWVRVWMISADRRRLELVSVVGGAEKEGAGQDSKDGDAPKVTEPSQAARGVINDLDIFERGDRGKDGLCIVAALGKEHRLGRWKTVNGKNGAVLFEIPRVNLQ